jgi:hypothetical protein
MHAGLAWVRVCMPGPPVGNPRQPWGVQRAAHLSYRYPPLPPLLLLLLLSDLALFFPLLPASLPPLSRGSLPDKGSMIDLTSMNLVDTGLRGPLVNGSFQLPSYLALVDG